MSLYAAVKQVAYQKGKSIYQIEHDLNLSNGYIDKWNKHMPSAAKLQLVADYLGVTSSYLLSIANEGK